MAGAAKVGKVITISPFDLQPGEKTPRPGQYVITAAGSVYQIESSRQILSETHPDRYSVRCKVIARNDREFKSVPDGAYAFGLVWASRQPNGPRW